MYFIISYLQVSIPYPTAADAGVYVCQVNTVAKGGHGVSFKSSVDISATTPLLSDVVILTFL